MTEKIITYCKMEGCEKQAKSRGWCKPHYDAWYTHGDPSLYVGDLSHLTLWEKVEEIGWTRADNGCYEYNGSCNDSGYGQFRDKDTNKLVRVHRLVYQHKVGELLSTEVILHRCDNPACGDPTHLRKGSQTENIYDMYAKGRDFMSQQTHCVNGHLYTDSPMPSSTKNRCRQCARDRNRRYHQRQREGLNHGMASG